MLQPTREAAGSARVARAVGQRCLAYQELAEPQRHALLAHAVRPVQQQGLRKPIPCERRRQRRTFARVAVLMLETLSAHPATVLFVTHNLREAITLADRIALLAPAPTRVLREFQVPVPRERRFDSSAIEACRAALADELPGLALAG